MYLLTHTHRVMAYIEREFNAMYNNQTSFSLISAGHEHRHHNHYHGEGPSNEIFGNLTDHHDHDDDDHHHQDHHHHHHQHHHH